MSRKYFQKVPHTHHDLAKFVPLGTDVVHEHLIRCQLVLDGQRVIQTFLHFLQLNAMPKVPHHLNPELCLWTTFKTLLRPISGQHQRNLTTAYNHIQDCFESYPVGVLQLVQVSARPLWGVSFHLPQILKQKSMPWCMHTSSDSSHVEMLENTHKNALLQSIHSHVRVSQRRSRVILMINKRLMQLLSVCTAAKNKDSLIKGHFHTELKQGYGINDRHCPWR